MSVLGRKRNLPESNGKVLDVTANMQGSLIFEEPVALRISGGFSGTLQTRGDLTIGEGARVEAEITGEMITVAGQVRGKIIAKQSLKLVAPARLQGEIWTPSLEIQPGARVDGEVHMGAGLQQSGKSQMSAQEVSEYLEVDLRLVEGWAQDGKIPAVQRGGQWRFEKNKIDEWVAAQKSS
ncbi:MAG: hypothetical protein COV76_04955 [Candidatus Omnitrophica bacterium CG11_big_fil_rev_8_21_14_0_20_64_10]|nr:MAG: hypothetical protein COV76_04955 [Candidatus Omnitrophica bacterium CG11_big_fil_rev_8_21_14_0_20_64_10]